MNRLPGSLAAALVLASLPFVATSALAEGKDTVISVQTDPKIEAEPVCVALQLGTGLLKAGSKVTIFATLGGVGIANAVTYDADVPPQCNAFVEVELENDVPLYQILGGYLAAGGEILVCPLCWAVAIRDIPNTDLVDSDYPDQIYIANPIPLLSTADRVIDY
jgi:predicted peroxiredoxin